MVLEHVKVLWLVNGTCENAGFVAVKIIIITVAIATQV